MSDGLAWDVLREGEKEHKSKEAEMIHLRVEYKNSRYDYVPDSKLDALISAREIKRFFRPFDKEWVTIGVDPVRGSGTGEKTERERRKLE